MSSNAERIYIASTKSKEHAIRIIYEINTSLTQLCSSTNWSMCETPFSRIVLHTNVLIFI